MATKRTRSTTQRIMDTIKALVRQPLSDESNEVPTAAAVRRSKTVAAGKKAKKPAARKKTAARKKKR